MLAEDPLKLSGVDKVTEILLPTFFDTKLPLLDATKVTVSPGRMPTSEPLLIDAAKVPS